jgi:mono/diheme cytochrome c family protein
MCLLPGALAALAVTAHAQSSSGDQSQVARGRYLASIMDCGGCHTGGALLGKPDPGRVLAGSEVGFQIPGEGVVYPPNLTPDAEHGLGKWTDEEILRAVRGGQSRDGRRLAPIMPWPSYAALTDGDARALVAYLRSLAPVRFAAPRKVKEGAKPTAPYLTLIQPQ